MSNILYGGISETATVIGRRGFVKFLCYTTGLVGSTWVNSACEMSFRNKSNVLRPFEPILLEHSDGGVMIESPMPNLPLAYVSRNEKKIFVEYESRISVSVVLAAHISVSSGLWRIPLFGEDVRVPIDAGDPLREFSEHNISEWNPVALAQKGDYRIQRGLPVEKEISFQCGPILPGKGWVSGGPWLVNQCGGITQKLCREVFTSVGRGVRHDSKAYRICAGTGKATEFLSWVCPEV